MEYEKTESIDGTFGQGTIEVSFKEIFDKLGPCHWDGEGYKTDAEWAIKSGDTIATLYNWKNGKNYLGDQGLEIQDITEWNIGGNSKEAVDLIYKILNKDPE